jgi:hypothetical protein
MKKGAAARVCRGYCPTPAEGAPECAAGKDGCTPAAVCQKVRRGTAALCTGIYFPLQTRTCGRPVKNAAWFCCRHYDFPEKMLHSICCKAFFRKSRSPNAWAGHVPGQEVFSGEQTVSVSGLFLRQSSGKYVFSISIIMQSGKNTTALQFGDYVFTALLSRNHGRSFAASRFAQLVRCRDCCLRCLFSLFVLSLTICCTSIKHRGRRDGVPVRLSCRLLCCFRFIFLGRAFLRRRTFRSRHGTVFLKNRTGLGAYSPYGRKVLSEDLLQYVQLSAPADDRTVRWQNAACFFPITVNMSEVPAKSLKTVKRFLI